MRPWEHCCRDASLKIELRSARLAETLKTLGTVTFPPQLRLPERLYCLQKHWSPVPEVTYTNKHIRGFALYRLFAVYSVSFRNTLTSYTRVLTRLWRPLFQSPNKSLQNALPGFLRIPVEGYRSLVLCKQSFVESRIPEQGIHSIRSIRIARGSLATDIISSKYPAPKKDRKYPFWRLLDIG
jgi:hypothetical protein